mgnify:CR=1 FL=1
MKKIKQIWTNVCVAAIGVNIAVIVYGLLLSKYDLIPLSVINCLLLSTIFLVPEPHDD